ncbi:hypothetical protein BJ912DRAFT_235672 [Pholiota molesta]|nr:hypothetical protein BJ912DRAFT_235672 [Pholiota molesta]
MVCNGWSFSIVRRVIMPHLHRIEALSCPVYSNPEIIEFLTIDGAQFTILKSVTIWFINTRSNPLSSFPPNVCNRFCGLKNAPHLRKVNIRLTNGLNPTDLHLPWDRLTTMDFGKIAMSPEEFITIFQFTAFQLEDASFCIEFSNLLHIEDTLWKDVVTMHALQTLRLKLLFPSADTRLFSHLRFPVLKYAWIQMHDHFQDWDTSLYTELFRASTKCLQILHLTDYLPRGNAVHGFAIRRRHRETTHGSLEKLFEVITNVRYLHLPLGIHIHTVTLEKMASYALLPQLHNLDLGTINAWPVLLMARQRRAHLVNPQGTSRSLETAASKPIEDYQPLGFLKYINIIIPRHGHGFSAQDHAALIAETRALGLLGIQCRIQGTSILPLPLMKSVPQANFSPPNLNAQV